MRLSLIVAAAALLSASFVARADTTEYTVTVDNPSTPSMDGTFSFTEPAIVDDDFTVNAAQFLSSTNDDITSVSIDPIDPASIEISYSDSGPYSGVFGFESLTGYYEFEGSGPTVDITDLGTAPTPTPEPSSFILLGTGLLGVAGVMRRRFV